MRYDALEATARVLKEQNRRVTVRRITPLLTWQQPLPLALQR
jgi:hypothetical protein